MPLDPGTLQPIARADGRRAAVDVYESLRHSILSGRIKPGTILSQVEVARALEVSRTPVREAMRMLQEAGLVSSEPNFRSQVLGFDPIDIEALYMKRIVLEAFGVSLTTRHMTSAVANRLQQVIEALEGDESHNSFVAWQELHRELHGLLVSGAGDSFAADMRELEVRSARYQSAYKGENPAGWWQRGETEHRQMFEAMRAGNAPLAGQLAARHLARTALEVLAALSPEHDTSKVRASLAYAVAAVQSAP